MNRSWILFLTLMAAFLFSLPALGGDSTSDGLSKDLTLSKNNLLLKFITMEGPYTDWKMWPGKDALYEGQKPHGVLLTTYVNDIAYKALMERPGEMPDGGIIVKENYTPDEKLAAVTVMYKEKGFDPNHNDWYYLKYAPDCTIEAQGGVQSCMECHAKAKGNDWLFTGRIGK